MELALVRIDQHDGALNKKRTASSPATIDEGVVGPQGEIKPKGYIFSIA